MADNVQTAFGIGVSGAGISIITIIGWFLAKGIRSKCMIGGNVLTIDVHKATPTEMAERSDDTHNTQNVPPTPHTERSARSTTANYPQTHPQTHTQTHTQTPHAGPSATRPSATYPDSHINTTRTHSSQHIAIDIVDVVNDDVADNLPSNRPRPSQLYPIRVTGETRKSVLTTPVSIQTPISLQMMRKK